MNLQDINKAFHTWDTSMLSQFH